MKYLISMIALVAGFLFSYADSDPSFPGGSEALKKYVSENTRYPQSAKDNEVEGVVVVGFIVMTDGSLKEVKIVKFVDPDLEKESLRVVNGMPAWIPAQKGGVAVEAPAKVDIPFILE